MKLISQYYHILLNHKKRQTEITRYLKKVFYLNHYRYYLAYLFLAKGQMIFQGMINANEGKNQFDYADEQSLPAGIYFMNIIYDDNKIVQKIVKNLKLYHSSIIIR